MKKILCGYNEGLGGFLHALVDDEEYSCHSVAARIRALTPDKRREE